MPRSTLPIHHPASLTGPSEFPGPQVQRLSRPPKRGCSGEPFGGPLTDFFFTLKTFSVGVPLNDCTLSVLSLLKSSAAV